MYHIKQGVDHNNITYDNVISVDMSEIETSKFLGNSDANSGEGDIPPVVVENKIQRSPPSEWPMDAYYTISTSVGETKIFTSLFMLHWWLDQQASTLKKIAP
jgi:hypothetical protein